VSGGRANPIGSAANPILIAAKRLRQIDRLLLFRHHLAEATLGKNRFKLFFRNCRVFVGAIIEVLVNAGVGEHRPINLDPGRT
jgi:hypothetical protein